MHLFWWALFIGSITFLVITLFRSKYSLQWLGMLAMNTVIAALLLYFVNWFGQSADFHIAMNESTIATIGILGVPGLLLLISVKTLLL